MESYKPSFENPYPDRDWSSITGFQYRTPLVLYRHIEAVRSGNGRDAEYVVARPYRVTFELDREARAITVPAGLLTDLASVPRLVRPVIGKVGPHLEASIVHDFLYIAWQDLGGRGARDRDRAFADKLMRVAMAAANVTGWKIVAIYNAVRLGGNGPYKGRDRRRYVRIPEDAAKSGDLKA